jgi:ABC-type lipoprotein release transport system permease subunit
MILKLAFRNIWRNKGRSLITIASIFFAVLFSSFMNAFQKGAWERMLDNVVNFYYGYVQIHKQGYWDDQTINNAFMYPADLEQLKEEIPEIREVTPRLESFALASYNNKTSGLLIVGTEPEREDALTSLKAKLVEGAYLASDDQAILISEGIKGLLDISLGDTLVLISQGYHGVNAAGKYPIRGIVKFASPDLNNKMVYLPLKEAQYFFGANGLVTTLGLKLDDRGDIPDVVEALHERLPASDFEEMDWKKMIPELVEAQKTDAAGNYIFLIVLYVLITFGIFGTILMMVKEREYEFGVLTAIGMKRRILSMITWTEIIIMGLMGAFLGIVGSIPLVYYFKVNPLDLSGAGEGMTDAYEKWGFDPIVPTAFEPDIFLYQALIVFMLTSFLAFYAIFKIHRLKPVEAMRN